MIEILPRHFVEKPWGRTDLPTIFEMGDRRIGEVWFDKADVPLPVLVKWLFTSENLSIQVHPSDGQAAEFGLPSGKEECWIVVDAEEDARLGIGLTETLSAEQLREASLSGRIEHLMDWKRVQAGDWFFIPAGTVHAIGAGVRLVEIQQNADITYRLYDYGRPRELHLDHGVAVSNPAPFSGLSGQLPSGGGMAKFLECPHFSIDSLRGSFSSRDTQLVDRLFIPVTGEFRTAGTSLVPGQVGMGRARSIEAASATDLMLICTFR